MTESRVFIAIAVLLGVLVVLCGVRDEWLGALGSALGASQALSARYFLLKWKPSAAIE